MIHSARWRSAPQGRYALRPIWPTRAQWLGRTSYTHVYDLWPSIVRPKGGKIIGLVS
jgi:hypothetical protein